MTTQITGLLISNKDTELLYEFIDARDYAFMLSKLRDNDCAPDGSDCYTIDKQNEVYGKYLILSGKVYFILQNRLNAKLKNDDLESAINAIKKVNEDLALALKKQKGAVAAVKAITTAISIAETVITKAIPLAFGQFFYTNLNMSSQAINTSSSADALSLSTLVKVISSVCEDSEISDVARDKAKVLLSRLGYLQLYSFIRDDVFIPLAFSDLVDSLLADADAHSAKLIDIHEFLSDFEYALRAIEFGLFVQDSSLLSGHTKPLADDDGT
jgi:hypothetical protein